MELHEHDGTQVVPASSVTDLMNKATAICFMRKGASETARLLKKITAEVERHIPCEQAGHCIHNTDNQPTA